MHSTTDLAANGLPKADADLSPAERLQEIAAIFADGILRLRTRPESMPKPAPAGPEIGPEKTSDSAPISLDVRRDISPHVADG